MISVVISTYNRKPLLKRAIKSVLAQSYTDFELIVVDDSSTDGTKFYVSSLEDKRIKYIRTKKNSGHDGLPKNLGIQAAKGEYIVFLDDDDVMRKDGLKVLVKYIQATGVDVVYGDYINIHGKKHTVGWSLDFSVPTLSKMNFIALGTVIVKRSVLMEVGGFDQSIPKFKDWNMWLRIQKRGFKFMHVPIVICEIHHQDESVTNKHKVETDEAGNYLPTFFNPADCEIYATNTILGTAPKLKVAVFTLTMDRLEYTKKMYEAMRKTAGYDFDWFVIDQASSDGTIEWLKNSGAKVFPQKENIGIAKGWNLAADEIKKAGNYDIIIKIDNDAEMMTNGWLQQMVALFKRNRTIILSPYVEGLEDSPGGVLRQSSSQSPYTMINDKILGLVPYLGGICWAAPIEMYKEFKLPEDSFFSGNKDWLASQYAKSIGYNLFYLEETRLAHIDGTKGQHEKYPEYFKKQKEAMEKKYETNTNK